MRLIRLALAFSCLLGWGFLLSCSGSNRSSENAPDLGPHAALVALPSSAVVVADSRRVAAYTPAGKPDWTFSLPGDDTVAAPPVAALDSTTYVLGARSLYAIAPDGKLLWQAKHEGGGATIKGLVPLGDSTVAMTAGGNALTSYTAGGQPRWTFTLPNGDRLAATPAIGANSLVYLRGGRRLYAVDVQGNLSWQVGLTPE